MEYGLNFVNPFMNWPTKRGSPTIDIWYQVYHNRKVPANQFPDQTPSQNLDTAVFQNLLMDHTDAQDFHPPIFFPYLNLDGKIGEREVVVEKTIFFSPIEKFNQPTKFFLRSSLASVPDGLILTPSIRCNTRQWGLSNVSFRCTSPLPRTVKTFFQWFVLMRRGMRSQYATAVQEIGFQDNRPMLHQRNGYIGQVQYAAML